jgi:radical SAM superfamily enzyme YgiQ (UPF0313 family)
MRSPGDILLISCYELGHQPLGVALPLGFLQRAGFEPDAMDIAVDPFDTAKIQRSRFVGISVPMHTALRLGVRVAERVRALNPDATLCFYGLYAALNADYLLEHGGDYCIGGEVEAPLVALVEALSERMKDEGGRRNKKEPPFPLSVEGVIQRGVAARPYLHRLPFALPARQALAALDRYARLEHQGERRVTGYVEASRGCLHL